jgi:hypothetical protein
MRFTRGVVGYTRPVSLRWTVLLLGLLANAAVAQIPAPVTAEVGKFEHGKIIEKVSCAQRLEQSYALYLLSNYSASRSWPVVYSFVRSRGTRQFRVATSKRRRIERFRTPNGAEFHLAGLGGPVWLLARVAHEFLFA